MSDSIVTTSLALGNCPPPIEFPSGLIPEGQPGSNLKAFLIQFSSNFGFNTSPHRWNTSWIPQGAKEGLHGASGNLPPVGSIIGFTVGEHTISGVITHADYRHGATQGTTVTIQIEDTRECLNEIKIHTEDLGDSPGSGNISIARGYRRKNGLFNLAGQVDDALYFEYRNILENGNTYPQILEAIAQAIDDGELTFDISKLPTIAQLEANLGGTASSLRFKFNMTPLTEVITRVLQDTAYDWYWSLADSKVLLVNRKVPFDFNESELISIVGSISESSGLQEVKTLGFGTDEIKEPRKVRLLGAHQEGFINSELLGPIDGLDTQVSGVIFVPSWRNLKVSFNDASGILRTYTPTDRELKMALNGIETWTYYKKFQTTPIDDASLNAVGGSGFGLLADEGSIAAQHPDFQSRLDPFEPIANFLAGDPSGQFRLINNRRDLEHNWVLAFFNRVHSHASRHYGKSYVASGVLINNASGAFRLLEAAWANVENQIEGQDISEEGAAGPFVQGYEINRKLGPVAPFKTVDDKIRAHCKLPSFTVYGPQGDQAPASFGDWTEDAPPFNPSGDGSHFIPVRLSIVGQQVINPRAEGAVFEDYPDGTILCQLPNLAGSATEQDLVLGNLVTLVQNALDANVASGLVDILDLSRLITPFETLSGVAIPVAAPIRYGMQFPEIWVSGELSLPCDAEAVIVDDTFGPWNFPPQGNDTSLEIMSTRAFNKIRGAFISASESRFADIEQVGFPLADFDDFANQGADASGFFGVREHGITDLNLKFGARGFTTQYKIASFFSEFGREAPLSPRLRSILNGIINPIDFTDLILTNDLTAESDRRDPIPPGPPPFVTQGRGARTERVTITEVNNALTFTTIPDEGTQERYRGQTTQAYIKPHFQSFGIDDFRLGAICVDGFLNLNDEAIYHEEDFVLPGGTRVERFFTGGRPFADATIVLVSGIGSSAGIFDVAIENTNPLRRLVDVPVLNGTVLVGDRSTLATQAGVVQRFLGRPGASLSIEGVFLNPGGGTTDIPVEVVSVSGAGTSGAIVSVRPVDTEGNLNPSATLTSGVVPLPFREFAIVGDKGLLVSTTAFNPSTGDTEPQSFFMGSRDRFIRFD